MMVNIPVSCHLQKAACHARHPNLLIAELSIGLSNYRVSTRTKCLVTNCASASTRSQSPGRKGIFLVSRFMITLGPLNVF